MESSVVECGPRCRSATLSAPDACRNCGAQFADAYCGACGQKRFVQSDRRFGHLAAQLFSLVTDLDGRLWGSLRALLLRPGLLERDYMAGRRRRWLPPVTLFLLANLVYFMAPLRADFDLSFVDQVPGPVAVEALGGQAPAGLWSFPGQLHSAATTPLLERVLARRDARQRAAAGDSYGLPELRRDYDAIAADVSKALLVVHVPFVALLLMAAMAGSRRYYAEHFVVALHFLAFLMLATLVFGQAVRWLQQHAAPELLLLALSLLLLGLLVAWTGCQVMRGYGVRPARAALGVLALLGGTLLVNVTLYRALQFVLTLLLL
jgi:hypothetical protein